MMEEKHLKLINNQSQLSDQASDLETVGKIFNIQKYSIYDGDGIRTIVFFKGCNFHCPWCSNPESINRSFEVMFNANNCVNCGKCVSVCPVGIHFMQENESKENIHYINRNIDCIGCRQCEAVCISNSLDIMGEYKSVKEIIDVIVQDIDFYHSSGGGVTLSGGEASLQIDFACALLRECKRHGINTAIETQGSAPQEYYTRLAECTDTFLFDLKQIDNQKHMNVIKGSNIQVYKNLEHLVNINANIVVRMPLIKGFNDTYEHIHGTFEYVTRLRKNSNSIKRIEVLPYHKYGVSKYEKLDQIYNGAHFETFTAEELAGLTQFFKQYDLPITLIKH